MMFGTILVDPPWNYNRSSSHSKLTGYCDKEYDLLTTEDLIDLPVKGLGTDESVLLLWCTWPFLPDGLKIIDAWDYSYVTGLTWIKTMQDTEKLSYGVGYWFRGNTEMILVGRRKKAYRTNWMGMGTDGLVSPRLTHSRKPEDVYELAQSFPGPHLELFARHPRENWYSLGNELPGDSVDIRIQLPSLIRHPENWINHLAERTLANA